MTTNEQIIREVYAAAEGTSLNADRFATLFHDDGYFLDQGSGMRWTGDQVRQPIQGIASAFPDMHRELLSFYEVGDAVIVELRLQGTHLGDLRTAKGVVPPTGETFDIPCCDVFHLRDEKVVSFHCYNEIPAWFMSLASR
ncbi:nuclear transport factor 2 family protein [Sphingomonadaceae bacterium OTU29LAMAA1]|nr:nuclear transport factor 2 family protein [Sphingomonadaceae bacterium OTU29LAMAA1]